MKRFKPTAWLATLAFALFALLGAASPAVAADIKSDDTVTVTIKGLEEGVEAETYQIFTVNWNDAENVPNDPVYRWNESMVAWLNSNGYGKYIDGANGVAEEYGKAGAAFFDKLAAAIKGSKVTVPSVDKVISNADGNLLMTEKMGGYLAIINNSANRVYQPIAFNVFPEYKNGEWTLTSNHEDAAENVKWRKFDIKKETESKVIVGKQYGDVISYDITVDVPQYPANASEASKRFTVSDKFDAGLTYNNDVKAYGIKGDKKDPLVAGTDYTVATQDLKGNDVTFALSFKYPGIAAYDKVVLEYTGTLNQDAVIGSTGNRNEAILEWNNKPYDENGYERTDPYVIVYSYGLEVLKHAKGDTTTVLEGAVFNVSLKGNDLYFTKADDGSYKVATKDTAGASKDVITDAKGKLLIKGLNEGTYQLTETVPPAGYNKPAGPFTVVIKAVKDGEGNVTGKVENEKTNGYAYAEIPNTTGFQLPTTGGAGTVAITAAGVVIMAGAGMMLVRGRKSK